MKKEITNKLNDLLSHDYDMDGFGNGYEKGVKDSIDVVSLHHFTSKELCSMIQNYVIHNGIEALTIELNKYWENGFLINVQVKLNEEGKRYIYE
jgi:uncharacterized protein YajQ (UPF0234 family)